MKAFLLNILLLFFSLQLVSQSITVPPYSACPNQTVVVTPQWNNVGNVNYTILIPAGGSASPITSTSTFVISHTSSVLSVYSFTILGAGANASGPITSSVAFNLSINPPAPLTITNTVYYCPGQTATISAPTGGYTYNIAGPAYSASGQNPIITISGLGQSHNGQYTITSVGTCTAKGVTTVSVAPNTPLAVNGASNVCQGGTVQLTANLATATNFQWIDPYGQNFASVASTVISNILPSAAGPYTVNADLPWGNTTCPKSAQTQISVVSTSSLTASASPTNILCQGDKLTFSALSGSVQAVGWSWAGPQGFVASISNPTINPVAPLSSGSYSVSALFTNGIITCQTNTTINVSVITVNQPVITMPLSVCQNVDVPISATAAGAVSYTWNGPAFGSTPVYVPTTTITAIQPNSSGIYYVSARFTSGGVNCVSSSSVQLNVIPVNSVTVIPPSPVCIPSNGLLQSSAIGASQFVWNGPGGFSAPGPNATVYNPSITATGVYTVTAYFQGGGITCSNTNTAQLTVNPVLNFTLTGRQQVCYNTTLSVTGPAGATSYSWSSTNGYTSHNKDITFSSIQPNNAGTYTLDVSLGPCITSATTQIAVLTPVAFTLTPQSRTVCKGDTIVLEAGLTGGSQNYAFFWNPAVYFDGPSGPKKVAVPLGSVIYNVVAHDIACPNFTVGKAVQITVQEAPKPNLQLNRTSGCAPFVMYYDSKTQNTSTITTYNFGGLQRIQGDGFTYTLSTPGTYSLVISTVAKDGLHCKADFPYNEPLIVYPKPGSNITWLPENPSTTDEIIFSSSNTDGAILNKQWSFSGGAFTVIDTSIKVTPPYDTTSVEHPSRIYETIGKYPVMLISKNEFECSDTVVKFLTVIDDFRLFIPNTFSPNGDGINDKFGVKGTGVKLDGFSMEITDRWGDQVFYTKDINEWWDGKTGSNVVQDHVYIYRIRAVGMNGEGRREFVGYVTVLK